jgi:hypothetical protein
MPGLAEGGAIFAINSVLKLTRTEFSECQAGASDGGGDGKAAPMRGGAVAARSSKLWCEGCLFSGNSASLTNRGETAKGGAVFAERGEAHFLATLFSSNSAVGGRIGLNGTPGGGTGGGALWLSNATVIQRCSFISNFVKGGDTAFFNHAGGASPPDEGYGGAVASFGSLLAVTNSTFAFNAVMSAISPPGSAAGDAYGGAIYSAGSASVSFSTIASNTLIFKSTGGDLTRGAARGGGLFATNLSESQVELTLEGCVIAGNVPGNFATNLPVRIRDAGANISSDSTLKMSGPGSLSATEAKLGPFQRFGETYTFSSLRPDSPAIGRGTNITSAAIEDQLGFPRLFPDAGAIEWQGSGASLELTRSTPGEMRLNVRDPAYSLRLLEGSSDLENWTELGFEDYSPHVVSGKEKRMFFRLR